MLYNLILVIFLSNGTVEKVPLVSNIGGDRCVDVRDSVRGSIDYLNNLDELVVYDGSEIEFVDSECVSQGYNF